jgi:hypothetical protein
VYGCRLTFRLRCPVPAAGRISLAMFTIVRVNAKCDSEGEAIGERDRSTELPDSGRATRNEAGRLHVMFDGLMTMQDFI